MAQKREDDTLVKSCARTNFLILAIICSWFAFPAYAMADVIWPALILEGRILTIWSIFTGLIVEFILVRLLTAMKALKSIGATVAMNGVSTIIGVVLIPLSGIIIEFFPGLIIHEIFHVGTFNPYTWGLTVIVAATVNTTIELPVLRWFVKTPSKRKTFFWLLLANLISVGVAAVSLLIDYPKNTPK